MLPTRSEVSWGAAHFRRALEMGERLYRPQRRGATRTWPTH
ncbi:MAG: hypothetical protein WKF75_02920 [Singulisphaera sp.]